MGLVEVVIAVGLLVTLAAGVVHLSAMSARSVVRLPPPDIVAHAGGRQDRAAPLTTDC
jgi:hypothetical protein